MAHEFHPISAPYSKLSPNSKRSTRVHLSRMIIVFGLLFITAGILCLLFPPALLAASAVGMALWHIFATTGFLMAGCLALVVGGGGGSKKDESGLSSLKGAAIAAGFLCITAAILCFLFPPAIVATSFVALIIWHAVLTGGFFITGAWILTLTGLAGCIGYLKDSDSPDRLASLPAQSNTAATGINYRPSSIPLDSRVVQKDPSSNPKEAAIPLLLVEEGEPLPEGNTFS